MVLIKCCDISNEVRPFEVSEPWVDCLLEEYFNQVKTALVKSSIRSLSNITAFDYMSDFVIILNLDKGIENLNIKIGCKHKSADNG